MSRNLKLDIYSLITRLEDKAEQLQRPYFQVTNFDTGETIVSTPFKHRIEGSSGAILKETVDMIAFALAAGEETFSGQEITKEMSDKIVDRTIELKKILKEKL